MDHGSAGVENPSPAEPHEEPVHAPAIRFVGVDVHADAITVAVAEEGRGEARHVGRYANDLTRLLKQLDRLGER